MNFIKHDYGWELEDSGKRFLGKPVSLSIDTKIDSDHTDQEIFPEQHETLKIIDAKWDKLAASIEAKILAYQAMSRQELLEVLDQPHIWLSMDDDTNKPWKNNRWSFVLGVTESEDFGWHVEFNGDIHQETWAGG